MAKAIAEDLGVSDMTVTRARASGSTNVATDHEPEKRRRKCWGGPKVLNKFSSRTALSCHLSGGGHLSTKLIDLINIRDGKGRETRPGPCSDRHLLRHPILCRPL